MPSVGRRITALAAVACVAVGVLSGCVGSDPKPSPTPKPTATPLYSSDAKALAAAKDAFAKYVQVSNEVGQSGWVDLAPLAEVETGDALAADTKVAEANKKQGLRTEGDALGTINSVQRVAASFVVAYACVDVSATRLVDTSGTDQTPTDRADIYPFEVRFVRANDALVVGRSDRWTGKSFC